MEKLLSGEVVDVYEVINEVEGRNGTTHCSCGHFISSYEANSTVKNSGYVKKHKALMTENEITNQWEFYLLEMISVDMTCDEANMKQRALNKLTEEEKLALGLIEQEVS